MLGWCEPPAKHKPCQQGREKLLGSCRHQRAQRGTAHRQPLRPPSSASELSSPSLLSCGSSALQERIQRRLSAAPVQPTELGTLLIVMHTLAAKAKLQGAAQPQSRDPQPWPRRPRLQCRAQPSVAVGPWVRATSTAQTECGSIMHGAPAELRSNLQQVSCGKTGHLGECSISQNIQDAQKRDEACGAAREDRSGGRGQGLPCSRKAEDGRELDQRQHLHRVVRQVLHHHRRK